MDPAFRVPPNDESRRGRRDGALGRSRTAPRYRRPAEPGLRSDGGREGELRPYTRARVPGDAPAAGQRRDEVQTEAAAVRQVRPAPRDRAGYAGVRHLEEEDLGAHLGAHADRRVL